MEALTESIYHCCPDGRNATFMDYNLNVSRCYMSVLKKQVANLLDFTFTVSLRSPYDPTFYVKRVGIVAKRTR